MESGSEFLQRKAQERDRFSQEQRFKVELHALRAFAMTALTWKVSKRSELSRQDGIRRLRELGVHLEGLI
jgi:hypothetical protein